MTDEVLSPESFGGTDEGSHYMSQMRIRSNAEARRKVYVAAPGELQEQARAIAKKLEALGFKVTSRWLYMDLQGDQADGARVDLQDINKADILLLINPAEFMRSGTGGRHVEFGYAAALGKQLVVLGVRSNVFHHLSNVRVIERAEDF